MATNTTPAATPEEKAEGQAVVTQAKADAAAQAAKTMPVAEPGPLDESKLTRVDPQAKAKPEGTPLPVVEVLIERNNNEKISTEVFKFEVPILQALHGETRVIEGDEVFDVAYSGDANDMFRNMVLKYNTPQAGEVVQRAYRNVRELADETGLPMGKTKQAPASANVDNRKKK